MLAPAVIKTIPEDWKVIEELQADHLANIRNFKEGEHLHVRVEKENFNTLEIVGLLADFFKHQVNSIGY